MSDSIHIAKSNHTTPLRHAPRKTKLRAISRDRRIGDGYQERDPPYSHRTADSQTGELLSCRAGT